MSSAPPLDIKVIYTASSRPGRKRRAVVSTSPAARASSWILIGVLSLAAAGVTSYVAWWRVDKFIYGTFTWSTPMPGVDADELVAQMFPGLADAPDPGPLPLPPSEELVDTPRYVGATATTIITATAYSWLTIATITSCALALSAGAALGRAAGSSLRRIAAILAVVAALALGWATYEVLSEYGTGYPVSYLRSGMCLFVGLTALIGLAIGRWPKRLTRLAALTLIVSAASTVIAMHLGRQCGVISPERSTFLFLGLAFVLHSFYGWILLPATFRIRR